LGLEEYWTYNSSDLDPEEDKEQQKVLAQEFKTLLDWLKVEAKDIVRDGILSMFQYKSS